MFSLLRRCCQIHDECYNSVIRSGSCPFDNAVYVMPYSREGCFRCSKTFTLKHKTLKNLTKTQLASLERMTETRVYEPARLSTPPKPLFSLNPLDANLFEVIVI